MVSQRRLAQVKKGKDVSGPTEAPSIEAESKEQRDQGMLLTKLRTILADKAPEALPLLNRLLNLVKQSASLELLNDEKRSRSIVISGVPELDNGIASERQAHTEKSVISVLDKLDIEAKPTEIYRLGKTSEGRSRLIKCVFPSHFFYFEALKKAPRLRSTPGLENIFIRKSMTREERNQDRELWEQARSLNMRDHNGNRVYVVFRGQVVKATDVPKIKSLPQKN